MDGKIPEILIGAWWIQYPNHYPGIPKIMDMIKCWFSIFDWFPYKTYVGEDVDFSWLYYFFSKKKQVLPPPPIGFYSEYQAWRWQIFSKDQISPWRWAIGNCGRPFFLKFGVSHWQNESLTLTEQLVAFMKVLFCWRFPKLKKNVDLFHVIHSAVAPAFVGNLHPKVYDDK